MQVTAERNRASYPLWDRALGLVLLNVRTSPCVARGVNGLRDGLT
jgi:hypothetical protein